MTFWTYCRLLRRRWPLILGAVVVCLGAAQIVTATTTPVYRAQTELFVSAANGDGQVAGLNQGGQFALQRVKSYSDIVGSRRVAAAVIDQLGLTTTPDELSQRIEATVPLDTVLIDVTVTDASPQQAQRIADAVATQFIEVARKLEQVGTDTAPVSVSVVQGADLPQSPASPHPAANLALGLAVGLALGIALATVRDAVDTRVEDAEGLQAVTGLPLLGTTAQDDASAQQPLIVHVDPRSPRAEAFRALRTNLAFVDVDQPPRSLVMTSAVAGEGKSTTTSNLAIALAQSGQRVVLVDGDLRRPSIATYLGLEGAVGLTDVLSGRVDLDDALQSWGTDGLTVLPSGPTPPNPSELLGSMQMRTLLQNLESRADMVLIDAPPLLAVTDAAVLSRLASGCLLVVRARVTKKEQVARAMEALHRVDARVFGTVLTRAHLRKTDAYGYSYRSAVPDHGGQAGWPERLSEPAPELLVASRGGSRPPTR